MNAVLLFAAVLVSPQSVTLEEAENRLVRNGFTESMWEAQWAVKQGAKIVPILDKMLSQKQKYVNSDDFTGAFPYNAEYALAHIDVDAALAALKKYKVTYGIQGWNLRRSKKSKNYGVVHFELSMYPAANQKGKAAKLKPGTQVRIIKAGIENAREESARGGPATYDHVEVLATKKKGYVLRAGDNFDPFF